MHVAKALLACLTGATLAAGCASANDSGTAGGGETLSTNRESSLLLTPQIPPQATAVTINHNANITIGHETWIFVRTTDSSLYGRVFDHDAQFWSDWILYSSGDVAGTPLTTVWKHASGTDILVLYMLGTDGVIWGAYINPDTRGLYLWLNVSSHINAAAWQYPMLYSAVNVGYDQATVTHLLMADSSNKLWTMDSSDFGSTGLAVHQVFSSTGAAVYTNTVPPTLSRDGEVIVGRNTLSSGNDTLGWKAPRNQTAHGYKIDQTVSGAWGIPVPGRFAAGAAGSLTNDSYYLTDSNQRLRRYGSSADLCRFLTGAAVGSPVATAHGIFIPYNDRELLQIGQWAGTAPDLCYKWSTAWSSAGFERRFGSPIAADDSQLQGWSIEGDGANVFWRQTDSTGKLDHCFITGIQGGCNEDSVHANWVLNTSVDVRPAPGP